MAGPQDIQRLPKGLIDLLGMKATGNTPAQLAQQVISTLNTDDLYLIDRCLSVQGASSAVNALGTFAFANCQVPAGSLYLLYSVGISVPALAAASSVQLTGVINRAGGFPTACTDQIAIPASTGAFFGRAFDRPILMRPNDVFAVQVSNFTGVPGSAPLGSMWFAEIRI